jgi:hypothetical protein
MNPTLKPYHANNRDITQNRAFKMMEWSSASDEVGWYTYRCKPTESNMEEGCNAQVKKMR